MVDNKDNRQYCPHCHNIVMVERTYLDGHDITRLVGDICEECKSVILPEEIVMNRLEISIECKKSAGHSIPCTSPKDARTKLRMCPKNKFFIKVVR